MEAEMKKVLIAIFLISALTPLAFSQIQTAKVTGGEVQGVVTEGISIFKGIPFAAPPVGDLRWKAPAPVQAWTGIKKADAFGLACMQAANSMGNTAPVGEDCLYLNVWTPAKKPGEKIPVIVWIYGGGFSGGSTSTPMYDGMGFAKKGVVLVSVAYRLGPFGFLAHSELSRESGKGSGAYGIEDMIAGLKWVKANVAQFGGDPSNVTIFGHSAGGAAVSMLAASPVAKGLFHRVICMSGGSFTPLQTSNQAGAGMGIPALKRSRVKRRRISEEAGGGGYQGGPSVERRGDPEKPGADGMGGGGFRPAADGYIVPSDLYSLYQAGRFNDTPILLGNTSEEAASMGGRGNVTPEAFEKQIKSQYGAHADAILSAISSFNGCRGSEGVKRSQAELVCLEHLDLGSSAVPERKRQGLRIPLRLRPHFARCRVRSWQRCAVCIPDSGRRTGGCAQTRGFETFRYDQLLLGQLRQKRRSQRTRSSQVAGFCRERSKGDGVRCNRQRETFA